MLCIEFNVLSVQQLFHIEMPFISHTNGTCYLYIIKNKNNNIEIPTIRALKSSLKLLNKVPLHIMNCKSYIIIPYIKSPLHYMVIPWHKQFIKEVRTM